MQKILVVGGGMAGLSFAHEAIRRGFEVCVVERLDTVGGMCRSFTHNDCILDVGVHIFHGRDHKVMERVRQIIPEHEWVKVKRHGKLYLQGKYIDWPINVRSLFQFPIILGFKVLSDQLRKRRTDIVESNYETELRSLYGDALYSSFFKPITGKFLKHDPRFIHSNWAFASIRAATKIEDGKSESSYQYLIDKNDEHSMRNFSIFRFLAKNLLTSRENEPFYYFKSGFGTLTNSYRNAIFQEGGKIWTSCYPEHLTVKDGKIIGATISGKKVVFDTLVWTGSIESLCSLLSKPQPAISRLHSKFVYVFLKQSRKVHQVCYYADPNVHTVRGTILSRHYRGIIKNPQVKDVICLEYTYRSRIDMSSDGLEKVKNIALRDLLYTGLIMHKDDIFDIIQLDIPNSYPILTVDYQERLAVAKKVLFDNYRNLILFGRQGNFSYENADVLIRESMEHSFFSPDVAHLPTS